MMAARALNMTQSQPGRAESDAAKQLTVCKCQNVGSIREFRAAVEELKPATAVSPLLLLKHLHCSRLASRPRCGAGSGRDEFARFATKNRNWWTSYRACLE
jgi:hypothetical protein